MRAHSLALCGAQASLCCLLVSDETKTRPSGWLPPKGATSERPSELSLVIAWSHTEPARVGESAVVPRGTWLLGRGAARPDDDAKRLLFGPLREGASARQPLLSGGLSRHQLRIRAHGETLTVERVGKVEMRVGGVTVDRAELAPGSALELAREMVLLCVAHEPFMAGGAKPGFAFGAQDAHGIVGEGARAWALRDELRMLARRPGHVLVLGPSGAGKELCARALHTLSAREKGPFVARNAATLPHGIIDAELFGNARNYPNAGMRERAGLLGEADGGTLFLDEIGELPEALQAHLLRVLDDGEYHRLGDDHARRADVRFIGATNRELGSLKHDFAARLKLSLSVPGLAERTDDVPLLANAILGRVAAADPSVGARFFDDTGRPRIAPELMMGLLTHTWTGHVRELETILLAALGESRDHFIALTDGVRAKLRPPRDARAPELSREDIERALARHAGNISRAWTELGLSSRDALNRLMKKHDISPKR